jgi:hypothetical protein
MSCSYNRSICNNEAIRKKGENYIVNNIISLHSLPDTVMKSLMNQNHMNEIRIGHDD